MSLEVLSAFESVDFVSFCIICGEGEVKNNVLAGDNWLLSIVTSTNKLYENHPDSKNKALNSCFLEHLANN